MAERTINIGVATYRRADGPEDSILWGFGMNGDVVDVHDDDLERFDRLNGPDDSTPAPLPEDPDPEVDPEDEPPRSGKGSGLDAWVAYAESLGIEVPEDASRDDVIDLVDAGK